MVNEGKAVKLKEGERIDSFIRESLDIIQSPQYFTFSIDAILLAHFTELAQYKKQRIMDFCSGNGVIPILLSAKTPNLIEGIEIQTELVEMAQRSVALNQLEDKIQIQQGDIRELTKPSPLYDVITCNPPYFLVEDSKESHHLSSHAIARHEIELTLNEWIAKAALLLRDKGKLFFVHRPNRLDDLIEVLLAHQFTVNRMQFIYPKATLNANVVLIEAIYRGGRRGVKIIPPIIVHQEDNQYTPEMQAIYFG